ncbi:MAG: DUF3488 and DUF4129 domain-containing transglutaminase family protein [Acidimicrobiales bacterium]
MTTVTSPPPGRTGTSPDPGAAGRQPGTGGPRPTMRIPAELSLWLVTIAAAVSFRRLFIDSSYLLPVVVAAAASHLLAAVLRRSRVPVALAALISAVVLVVVGTWLFYLSTTRLGLPTRLTWDSFTADLQEAVDRFREDQAPVEPVRGFVAGSAVGFWLVAFLGDWSAFRLWAPVEATVPAGSLFVFASLLGADQSRTVLTALFFIAAVLFLLVHRVARLEMSSGWVGGSGAKGARAQLAMGGAVAVVALVAVAVVGPLLPGATADPVFDVKDIGNAGGPRITVSPLVDIRQRLVDNRENVVFTVRSPVHSYWRLTALDEFDGRAWRSSKRFEEVQTNLPQADLGRDASFRTVNQTFTISNLAQIWLPAAYEAQQVLRTERPVRWDPSTSTLIVDEETSLNMTYSVVSSMPLHTAEELRAARGPIPSAIRDEYLTLPRDFPDEVSQLSDSITQGGNTAYDKALALQNYFRSNYTYSTEVTGGQDINAIEEFLFSEVKQGYCEQFAGSFAAMARSIGLPARVAVGFTLGDPNPDEPDLFVVKGRHSHAWPEVYLAGVGWVLFEPTPGRGSPNADYTGTSELQDSDIAPQGFPTTTSTTAPGDTTTGPTFDEGLGGVTGSQTSTETTAASGPGPVDSTGARVVLAVLGVAVLYVVVVPLGRRTRRRLRRRGARTGGARVDVAWREATETLGLLGMRPEPSETPSEFADRADRRSRAGTMVTELAGLTTAARYGPEQVAPVTVSRACELADGVERAVRDQTTAAERMRDELDPRPVLRQGWSWLRRGANTDSDTEDKPSALVGRS